jgi:hypothetical protein
MMQRNVSSVTRKIDFKSIRLVRRVKEWKETSVRFSLKVESMLSGFHVTMIWHVARLRMEETTSRHGR